MNSRGCRQRRQRREQASSASGNLALFAFNSVKIEYKFSVHHISSSSLNVICCSLVCALCLGVYGNERRQAHAMPFFNDFPSALLSCFVAGKRLFSVTKEKSAINIECHVGYYDVLIDCLTTNRFEAIFMKEEMIEEAETFDALPRDFLLTFLCVVFGSLLCCVAIESNDVR